MQITTWHQCVTTCDILLTNAWNKLFTWPWSAWGHHCIHSQQEATIPNQPHLEHFFCHLKSECSNNKQCTADYLATSVLTVLFWMFSSSTNRNFRYKWHWHKCFMGQRSFLSISYQCQSTEEDTRHWPQPVAWSQPVVVCHLTSTLKLEMMLRVPMKTFIVAAWFCYCRSVLFSNNMSKGINKVTYLLITHLYK